MAVRGWSTSRFTLPLPPGHRFPIEKYALIRRRVVERGILPAAAILEPERVERRALGLVHTPEYLDRIETGTLEPAELRRLGLPWSPELVERSWRTVQATINAADDALAQGLGITLAGGTHHAFADRGEGFCVFNDVAVAIRVLQQDGRIRRAAVVDLDVHQGNGTARIFAGDPDVLTFSMHGARNYPFVKEESRLDVGLDDGTGDQEYLLALARHLPGVLDTTRPDLVFYLAGADPYRGDRFGRLQLSMEGLRERDQMVADACRSRGIPVVLTMAGGYARELADIAEIHAESVRVFLAVNGKKQQDPVRKESPV